MEITVAVLNAPQLKRLFERLGPRATERVRAAVNETAINIWKRGKELAPVRTGRGRASIALRFLTGRNIVGEVYTAVRHMILQHQGTPPHDIVATRARVLRFQPKGGPVLFRKKVRHPGTKPNPFLARAAEEERPHFHERIRQALDDAMEGR